MPVTPTHPQPEDIKRAAFHLLGTRRGRMLTFEELMDMACVVAACHERKAVDCLTQHDLENFAEHDALEWDEATARAAPPSSPGEAFISPCSEPRRSSRHSPRLLRLRTHE